MSEYKEFTSILELAGIICVLHFCSHIQLIFFNKKPHEKSRVLHPYMIIFKVKRGLIIYEFFQQFKNFETRKHVTQKELAAHLCLSRSTIAGYETKSHQPDFVTLEKLATYFDVSIDFLILGENEKPQAKHYF